MFWGRQLLYEPATSIYKQRKSDLGTELKKIILWKKDGAGKKMNMLEYKKASGLICRGFPQ